MPLTLILHIIGTLGALIAAWFWFESSRIKSSDLDFLGRWSDDGKEEEEFIRRAARKNSRGAMAAAISALAFGINGLLQAKELLQ